MTHCLENQQEAWSIKKRRPISDQLRLMIAAGKVKKKKGEFSRCFLLGAIWFAVLLVSLSSLALQNNLKHTFAEREKEYVSKEIFHAWKTTSGAQEMDTSKLSFISLPNN